MRIPVFVLVFFLLVAFAQSSIINREDDEDFVEGQLKVPVEEETEGPKATSAIIYVCYPF